MRSISSRRIESTYSLNIGFKAEHVRLNVAFGDSIDKIDYIDTIINNIDIVTSF